MLSLIIKGFGTGYTLIPTIGVQNAYLLSHALKKQSALIAAVTCILSNAILILLGVAGVGSFIASHVYVKIVLTILGIAFLIGYAFKSFLNSYDKKDFITLDKNEYKEKTHSDWKKVIFSGLGVSLLNPHAILETVVLIGSITAPYNLEKALLFGLGSTIAASSWFLTLTFRAKNLSNFLKKKWAWKIIDFLTGALCLWIAYGLLIEILDVYILPNNLSDELLMSLG